MKDGKLHSMFISATLSTLGADFTNLYDGDKLLWYQDHTEDWKGGKFEEHTPV